MSDVRTCRTCGLQPLSSFERRKAYVYKGKQYYAWRCIACEKRKRKERYRADPEKSRKQVKAWRRKNPERAKKHLRDSYVRHREKRIASVKADHESRRIRVLTHYAGDTLECALCGEDEDRFLVLDHVNGGGTKHQKRVGKGTRFYRWVERNGYPDDLRVLCHNCNGADGCYGRVPPSSTGPFERPDLSDLSPSARHKQNKRIACLMYYGEGEPRCACCGVSNYEFLTLDHVDGDGAEHRRRGKIFGGAIYQRLFNDGFPPGFRVLCFNCNFAEARGSCPHRADSEFAGVPIGDGGVRGHAEGPEQPAEAAQVGARNETQGVR